MQNLSLPHLFLGGVVAYAVMYLLWSAFSLYDFSGATARLIGFAVLTIVMYLLSRSTNSDTVARMLPYAVVWTLTIVVLDIVLAVPYAGWVLFSDLGLWLGYAIVFFVPLVIAAQEDNQEAA